MLRRTLSTILLLALVGCGTQTSMVQVWSDELHEAGPDDRILIIGMTPDERSQRMFEDAMVREFKSRGYDAVASAPIVAQHEVVDEVALRAVIQEGGYDLVLATRLISVDEEQQYVAGSSYVYPSYYGGFYSYYATSYNVVHTPGYLREYKVVRLETNVYASGEENLVWSGVSETFDPSSANDAVQSMSKTVVSELRIGGIVH